MKHAFLFALFGGATLMAQSVEEPVLLAISVENAVLYRGNVSDVTKHGKESGPVATSEQIPFVSGINVGDIVAINGKPAKGIWSSSYTHTTTYRASPQPGQFIAEVDSGATFFCTWQIFAQDGTFLGMIRDSGSAQGHTVTGGLAGFFGATGVHISGVTTTPNRIATIAEDPANRRMHGGGRFTANYLLYPKVRPGVQMTVDGPAVYHSDFSQVTAANPARPGETLTIAATGLGPVKPNLLPPGAETFTSSPLQEVNGPVTVVFNGNELPAINKIGWPGERNLYRVDFQVPSGASTGTASLQVNVMWIPGSAVTIPVAAR
ncbi:MAG: hypothetical protein JNL98_01355 [Bryobacterales bacterium]|nr:hypothetical protein [Bryobacterales bacterium]